MIRLYGVAGACSLAPHIILEELELVYDLKLMQWTDKPLRAELKTHNPMGQVPTLLTEEGYPLAEGGAIMQYLISKKPNSLFPSGGAARFKAFEWMNFIATALHKAYIPLFKPAVFSDDETHFEAIKNVALKRLLNLLEITDGKLVGPYCLGNDFNVADAYLFTVLGWSKHFDVDLKPYRKLATFMGTMRERPAVKRAMEQEGL